MIFPKYKKKEKEEDVQKRGNTAAVALVQYGAHGFLLHFVIG
jgi:hypothetical protein